MIKLAKYCCTSLSRFGSLMEFMHKFQCDLFDDLEICVSCVCAFTVTTCNRKVETKKAKNLIPQAGLYTARSPV